MLLQSVGVESDLIQVQISVLVQQKLTCLMPILKTLLILEEVQEKEILNRKARIPFSNPHWLLPQALLSIGACVCVMAWFGQVLLREKGMGQQRAPMLAHSTLDRALCNHALSRPTACMGRNTQDSLSSSIFLFFSQTHTHTHTHTDTHSPPTAYRENASLH